MRFGGIILAALLLLGACSPDPEPKEPPTSSATPTAVVPTMPDQAKENTPEGAAAFVKHYIDVFNYAAQTGDDAPMKAIASRCVPCNEYAKDFRSLKSSGSLAHAPVWSLSDIKVETSHDLLEVNARVSVLNDARSPYRLTFVLSKQPPFELRDIYDRTN